MSPLFITDVETQPVRVSCFNEDGQRLDESTRLTSGTFNTPHGAMEFDKYSTTQHTLKKRVDLLVIRTGEAPPLEETIARINRAAMLGSRAVRRCSVVFGARLNQGAGVCEIDGDRAKNSTDRRFVMNLPLRVSDLAEITELDVQEGGEGLFWLRLSGGSNLEIYADNPETQQGNSRLAAFLGTESPNAATANPSHIRWQYADALLTPTAAELPGALGDMSLRAALLALRPGVI